jgi:uncharacterized phiE125 gp8 family phage protein
MLLERITNPVQRAISLDDAKAHLRVDTTDEDELIAGMLDAAIDEAARYTRRAVNQQTYRQTWLAWPASTYPDTMPFELDMAPVVSVDSLKYVDEDGNEATVADDDWDYRRTAKGAVVFFASSTWSWPTLSTTDPKVFVDFVAGYDADDGSSGDGDPELKMPPALKQAIMLSVGHFFANRESVVTGKVPMVLPLGAERLLDYLKIYR